MPTCAPALAQLRLGGYLRRLSRHWAKAHLLQGPDEAKATAEEAKATARSQSHHDVRGVRDGDAKEQEEQEEQVEVDRHAARSVTQSCTRLQTSKGLRGWLGAGGASLCDTASDTQVSVYVMGTLEVKLRFIVDHMIPQACRATSVVSQPLHHAA